MPPVAKAKVLVQTPSDWRGQLFYWSGEVKKRSGPKMAAATERSFSWRGDWSTGLEGAGQGGPNTFDCTLTLADTADTLLRADSNTIAAIRSSYLLDQGDGLGLQTFRDHAHDVIIGPAQTSEGRHGQWAVVAGCGKTEFGCFITHGRLSVDGPATSLLLARRYLRDSDSRAKLSPSQLLPSHPIPEVLTEDIVETVIPWRLLGQKGGRGK